MGDNIKKPDHYCEGREYEPKDVIRDWGLNFNLGSAVKYISRAGRKGDKLEDLKKAKQFLEFEIEADEKANIEILKEHMTCTYVNSLLSRFICFDSILDEYKARVIDKIAQKVLDNQCDIDQNIPTDELRKLVIDRIVEMINNDEHDCFDISTDLYHGYQDIRDAIARQALRKVGEKEKSDIGMTCKEAAEIGDNIAKGFEDGIKEEEGNSERETDIETERMTRAYAIGILSRVVGFNSIHDEYKPRVIDKITQKVLDNTYDFEDIPEDIKSRVLDKIAQEVLDSQCNITLDMPTNELRQLVIDRIVEMIDNGYFDHTDIPTSLYEDCRRILSAIASREYHKQKEISHAEDTVSINFDFEVDPDIDTDTVNVHVHIKNKED